MSISYNAYFASRSISRQDIAEHCRNLGWNIRIRDPSSLRESPRYVEPKGSLQNEDYFYGVRSGKLTDNDFQAALLEKHWDLLYQGAGGESIVLIDSTFNIHDMYDDESIEEIVAENERLRVLLEHATMHVEVMGGSYFSMKLSEVIARLGNGVWEYPQSDDWEIMQGG